MAGFGVYQIAWYFLVYAIIGWCLEVIYAAIAIRQLVNRGFLNGPACPIYGFGALLVLVALTPLAHNFLLVFIGGVLLTSLLELVAGYLLKVALHTSWWDYTNEKFNLGGYICLKFSLLWGVGCLIIIFAIQPFISGLLGLIPVPVGWVLLCILYSLLLIDTIVTILAVFKMNRNLGEITRIAEGIRRQSTLAAEGIGTLTLNVAEKVDALGLDEKKEQLGEKLQTGKQKLTDALQDSREKITTLLNKPDTPEQKRYDELINASHKIQSRLMRAFPRMQSKQYNDALNQIKKQDKKRRDNRKKHHSTEIPPVPDNNQTKQTSPPNGPEQNE